MATKEKKEAIAYHGSQTDRKDNNLKGIW